MGGGASAKDILASLNSITMKARLESTGGDSANSLVSKLMPSSSPFSDIIVFVRLYVSNHRYDKNHPATVSLEAFDGAQMEGHVFREQLKRVSKG